MAGNSKDIRAGGGYVELRTEQSALDKGLDDAKKKTQAFGAYIAGLGASIAAAGALMTAPFLYGLTVFAEFGKEIKTAARVSNMTFSEVQDTASGLRIGLDEVGGATRKMSNFLQQAADGSDSANEALHKMGITVSELASMTQEQRILRFADGIAAIGDAAERSHMQTLVFGRSGLQLNLTGGAAGVQARAAREEELGGKMTDADVRLAFEYNEAQRELGVVTKAIWRELGAAAVPVMLKFFSIVTSVMIMVRQWTEANRSLLTTIFFVADKLVLIGAIIGGVGGAIISFGFVIVGLKVALAALIPIAIILAKVALVAAVVAAVVYGLYEASMALGISFESIGSYLADFWMPLLEEIAAAAMGVGDALYAGDWALAFAISMETMKLLWEKTINWFKDVWYGFEFFFDDITWKMVGGFMSAFTKIGAFIETTITKAVNVALTAWATAREAMGLAGPGYAESFAATGRMQLADIERRRDNSLAAINAVTANGGPQLQSADRTREHEIEANLKRMEMDAWFAAQMEGVARQMGHAGETSAEGTLTGKGGSSVGTFEGGAAMLLGGSTSPMQEMVNVGQRQEEKLADILARLNQMDGLAAA